MKIVLPHSSTVLSYIVPSRFIDEALMFKVSVPKTKSFRAFGDRTLLPMVIKCMSAKILGTEVLTARTSVKPNELVVIMNVLPSIVIAGPFMRRVCLSRMN